jgi:hypothetical protein
MEIRDRLRVLGHDVYPKFMDVQFDPQRARPAKLPTRDTFNYYDTFIIRQEIERAVEGRKYQRKDFWTLESSPDVAAVKLGWQPIYQDPFRLRIFGRSMEDLVDISDKISNCIDDGLRVADVVVLTLGLTEVWRIKTSGLHICIGPKTKADPVWPLVEFHSSTFTENYLNVMTTINRIWATYPQKQIVLTVSPVALGRTHTQNDVVVANMISKSTLRAVVAQVCAERPEIIYWPSYEFAAREDVYKEDGRHVTDEAVARIIHSFLEAYAG